MMKPLTYFFKGKWESFFRLEPKALPLVRIGRMAAEATNHSIRSELENECLQIGINALKKRIEAEQVHFFALKATLNQWNQATHLLSANAAQRAREGYLVKGFFWRNLQEQLHKIASPQERLILNEKLDWIQTRKEVFEQLQNGSKSHDEPGKNLFSGI